MSNQSGPDLGYFVRVPSLKEASAAPVQIETPIPTSLHAPGAESTELGLVRGSGPRMNRSMAVLFALGGVFGGMLVFVILMMLSAFLSTWGSGSSGGWLFAAGLGAVVAVLGLTGGILIWRDWSVRPAIAVSAEHASVRHPGFRKPLVFPRSLVRVVAIDDQPTVLFQNNKRFPVIGRLPEEAFADALDQYRRPPWEPRDADLPSGTPGVTVPSNRWPRAVLPAGEGSAGHLWGNGGTALHFLRVNAEDVPNVAVIFHEPVKTPAAPFGFLLSPHCGFFLGSRRIRGFMARVEHPEAAREAFSAWDVVRDVTDSDVLEQGLRIPKPLRGWRALGYAAVFIIPILLKIIFRNHF